MGKKMWLSVHSRSFGYEKIACMYVTLLLHVSKCEMAQLLARSPSHNTLSV